MNRYTTLALAASFLLAGCAPTKYDCSSDDTQELVRRLYAAEIDQIARAGGSYGLMQAMVRDAMAGVGGAGTRRYETDELQGLDISAVQLVATKATSQPDDPTSGEPYQCSATVTLQLPAGAETPKDERISIARDVGITIQGSTLSHTLDFTSQLNGDGMPEVEMAISGPVRLMLGSFVAVAEAAGDPAELAVP